MGKKLVYLSGDDTVRVMEEDNAEQYQEELFQNALSEARAEGIVANDEDSEDYDSDIALKAGQDANGECKVFDLADIISTIKSNNSDEYQDFVDELIEAGDSEISLSGYEGISETLDNEDCEKSLIY